MTARCASAALTSAFLHGGCDSTRLTSQRKTSSGSTKHLSPLSATAARFSDKLRRQPHGAVGETAGAESGASGRDDIPQIRAWAEANGYEVSARGRIKKEVIDAYDAAHS